LSDALRRERLPVSIRKKDDNGIEPSGEIKTTVRIEIFLPIINEIESSFPGRCRRFHWYNLKGGKEKTTLNRIIDALYELMYENGAEVPLPIILKDYLSCVYRYYDSFGRKPYFTQLSPSLDNMTRFEDWLFSYKEDNDTSYWEDFDGVDVDAAREKAIEAWSRGDKFEVFDIGIEEV